MKLAMLVAILFFLRVMLPKLLMQWLHPITVEDMSTDPHEN